MQVEIVGKRMSRSESVVVTGIGVMTPAGDTVKDVSSALSSGISAVARLPVHNYASMPASFGGHITPQLLESYDLCPIKFRIFKPYLKYGVIATQNALVDAGLYDGNSFDARYPEDQRGVFVCQGVNGDNAEGLFDAFSESSNNDGTLNLREFTSEGINAVHPRWILTSISNNLIFFLTSEFGLRGDNSNVTYSAVGGAYMLEAAFSSIRSGKSSMAVVTGADSIINWQALDDIAKLGLIPQGQEGKHCKAMLPFSQDAAGALPSEGAAALVLEREDVAIERGARIYGRIIETRQHCCSEDALLPAKNGESTFQVLGHLLSLTDSNEEVMVNLNGMATPSFDASELSGVSRVMNNRQFQGLRCASSKHIFGHSFSASFPIDMAASLIAMNEGFSLTLPVSTGTNLISTATETSCMQALLNEQPGRFSHKKAIVLSTGIGGNTGGVLIEQL